MSTVDTQDLGAYLESAAQAPTVEGDQPDESQYGARTFQNFFTRESDRSSTAVGLSIDEVTTDLLALTGGFPRRVGDKLFCPTDEHDVCWLSTPQRLFAWIERQAKVIWAKGQDKIPQERFVAHLQMTAQAYDAVELVPHYPALPRTYYIHPPLPETDGRYLQELVDRFNPATPEDGQLIRAFFLSLLWGGSLGGRPAWMFTGSDEDNSDRGRGIGKSTLPKLASILVGGFIEIAPTENIGNIKTRLLSPAARQLRVARLDNIKTHRFSWGEMEALITTPVISGHEMYHGEGRRPNSLTWVITLNGASLSTDMAQRCMIVQLARPLYRANWEDDTRQYIESHKWHIISDIIQVLRNDQ